MVGEERSPQRQRWAVWGLVTLGVIVVVMTTLWDRWQLPSNAPETVPPRDTSAPSVTEPSALYRALGLQRAADSTQAPNFTLPSLDGRPVQLRELRGKVVLLNFWATWCAPCLQEMPSMERLHQTFKQTSFVLLAVSMDRQGAEVAQPFAESLKLTFPILLDPASEVARQYGVRGLPTTYLIDPDGLLIGAAVGARDWHRTEAKALIASLVRQIPTEADAPGQGGR